MCVCVVGEGVIGLCLVMQFCFAITLVRKREVVASLLLSSRCHVAVIVLCISLKLQ